ncbi:hypothetical protein DFJ74DRAFT_659920, partial [Hyaloraphidium curvatum]
MALLVLFGIQDGPGRSACQTRSQDHLAPPDNSDLGKTRKGADRALFRASCHFIRVHSQRGYVGPFSAGRLGDRRVRGRRITRSGVRDSNHVQKFREGALRPSIATWGSSVDGAPRALLPPRIPAPDRPSRPSDDVSVFWRRLLSLLPPAGPGKGEGWQGTAGGWNRAIERVRRAMFGTASSLQSRPHARRIAAAPPPPPHATAKQPHRQTCHA